MGQAHHTSSPECSQVLCCLMPQGCMPATHAQSSNAAAVLRAKGHGTMSFYLCCTNGRGIYRVILSDLLACR